MNEVRSRLEQLERHGDKMNTVLMVREPSSVIAADAYDGLRKQIVGAVSERLTHLAQLADFDQALSRGADADVLAKMVRSWLDQAALDRVSTADGPDANLMFELVSHRDGTGRLEVVEPAYVDRITGRIVKLGRARRVAAKPTARHASSLEPRPAAGDDGGTRSVDGPTPVPANDDADGAIETVNGSDRRTEEHS